MTSQEIEQLFDHNMAVLNTLNIASGSMFKALIMALLDNDETYIRLNRVASSGHRLTYTLESGDGVLVTEIASALGITVQGDNLVCNHG